MNKKYILGIFVLLVLINPVFADPNLDNILTLFNIPQMLVSSDAPDIPPVYLSGECDEITSEKNKTLFCAKTNPSKDNEVYIEASGNPDGCIITDGGDCNDNSGGCKCWALVSYGICKSDTLSCEAEATTEDGGWCQCGNEYTRERPWCLAEHNKVFSTQDECSNWKAEITECGKAKTVLNSQPEISLMCQSPNPQSCRGKPCDDGKGTCELDISQNVVCQYPKGNECEKISPHYSKCVRVLSLEPKYVDNEDKDHVVCYPGSSSEGDTYRFPSTAEVGYWAGGVGNQLAKDNNLDKSSTWNEFAQKWEQSSGLRVGLCGENADNPASYSGAPEEPMRTTKWTMQCCIKVPAYCGALNFGDAFMGPTDQNAAWLWNYGDKNSAADYWNKQTKTVQEWQKKLDENIAEVDLHKLGTRLVCGADGRKDRPEDKLLAEFESEIDDGKQIKMYIGGRKSDPLYDNTTLYELSWMVFNKDGSEININYSIYAKDKIEDKFRYAINQENEVVHGLNLIEGNTSYGYYAFYYNNTGMVEGLNFTVACVKHTNTADPYCNDFKGESYDDIPTESSSDTEATGYGSDAGNVENEV